MQIAPEPQSAFSLSARRRVMQGRPSARPTRLLRTLRLAMAAILPWAAQTALAACWHDASVAQAASSLARQFLPNVAARLPQILVCTGDQFGANVGATYTGGAHQILVQQRIAGTPEMRTVLIHELAHASVWLEYGDRPEANGHGVEWVQTMIRIGQQAEAERTSFLNPGGRDAYLRVAGAGRAPCTCQAPGISATAAARTTLAVAEAELAQHQCAEVLSVPGNSQGLLGYRLRSASMRSFIPLPQSAGRVRTIFLRGPGVVELEVMPSADGTASLICVN